MDAEHFDEGVPPEDITDAMGKKVADRNAENTIEQFGESLV